MGNYIAKIPNFQGLGAVNSQPWTDQGEIGKEEWTKNPLHPAKFHLHQCNVESWVKTKNNTSRAIIPGIPNSGIPDYFAM